MAKWMKKWMLGAVVLMLMTTILAACGGNNAKSNTSSGSQSANQASGGSASSSAGEGEAASEETSVPVVDLRLDVVATGTQSIPAFVLEKLELDKKHGFNLIVNENSGAGGANWTAIKTNMADAIITNWLDIGRNRAQTVPVYAVAPFLSWSNGMLVPADSSVSSVADLKGLKIGAYNTKSLDWVLIRAAAQRSGGFDPAAENEVTEGAPGLMVGLIEQKQVDAILNYGDMNTKLAGTGNYKVVFTVADVLNELDMNSDAAFLYYGFTETFIHEHPETVKQFVAAYEEAVEYLYTNDDIWTEIAEVKFDITDEAGVANLRDTLRKAIKQELPASAEEDARILFDWLKGNGHEELLGIEQLPETLFWFGE
jgi:NitT/TauT family transport system substrate-binding protein